MPNQKSDAKLPQHGGERHGSLGKGGDSRLPQHGGERKNKGQDSKLPQHGGEYVG